MQFKRTISVVGLAVALAAGSAGVANAGPIGIGGSAGGSAGMGSLIPAPAPHRVVPVHRAPARYKAVRRAPVRRASACGKYVRFTAQGDHSLFGIIGTNFHKGRAAAIPLAKITKREIYPASRWGIYTVQPKGTRLIVCIAGR